MTRKQQQVLDFILKWQRTQTATPTFQEIADQFGFRSLNSVTSHVRQDKQTLAGQARAGGADFHRRVMPVA